VPSDIGTDLPPGVAKHSPLAKFALISSLCSSRARLRWPGALLAHDPRCRNALPSPSCESAWDASPTLNRRKQNEGEMMKLRMLALFAIFALSAWPPYAPQQTSAHQAARQSQAPAISPAPPSGLQIPFASVATLHCMARPLPPTFKRRPAAMAIRSQARLAVTTTTTTQNPQGTAATPGTRKLPHLGMECLAAPASASPAAATHEGLQFQGRESLLSRRSRAVPRLRSRKITSTIERAGLLMRRAHFSGSRSLKLQAQHANQLFLQPLYLEFPRMLFLGSVVQRVL